MVTRYLGSDAPYPSMSVAGICRYGYGASFDHRRTQLLWRGHHRADVTASRGLCILEPKGHLIAPVDSSSTPQSDPPRGMREHISHEGYAQGVPLREGLAPKWQGWLHHMGWPYECTWGLDASCSYPAVQLHIETASAAAMYWAPMEHPCGRRTPALPASPMRRGGGRPFVGATEALDWRDYLREHSCVSIAQFYDATVKQGPAASFPWMRETTTGRRQAPCSAARRTVCC